MLLRSLQLVCSILVLSTFNAVNAQTSIATANGIVSAAGAPAQTQSISYSIEGEPALTATTSTELPPPTHTSGSDGSLISGDTSTLTNSNDHGLSTGAIVGITLAVILAIVGIVGVVILTYKRRKGQTSARAKRKSIMDMEFAAESKANLQQIETNMSGNTTIGFFDIAKPLPAVVVEQEPEAEPETEDNRLSRSSTIIGDAAEVAQINRKASQHHQRRQKAARDAVRERNHALQILITNEDNRTSVVPSSPSTSNPSTPIDASPNPNPQGNASCTDGDGDTFAKRPSKI